MIILFNLLKLYSFVIIIYVILSWLYKLNLLAKAPLFVHNFSHLIYRLVEPALDKIRKIIPTNSVGVDFSPFILYLLVRLLLM